jgi:hypothetical protein
MYRVYDKMSEKKRRDIESDSQNFLGLIKYDN